MDTQPVGPRDQAKSGATLEYLTAKQVGNLLQISDRTVERWALEDASMPALRRWLERSTQGSRKAKLTAAK
jgi:hypothetical protein